MTTDAKVLVSDFPISPGMVLREEIEARGISTESLAALLGISKMTLNKILNGKKAVTAELALDLEKVIDGISAQFWLNLDSKYQLTLARNRRKAAGGD